MVCVGVVAVVAVAGSRVAAAIRVEQQHGSTWLANTPHSAKSDMAEVPGDDVAALLAEDGVDAVVYAMPFSDFLLLVLAVLAICVFLRNLARRCLGHDATAAAAADARRHSSSQSQPKPKQS